MRLSLVYAGIVLALLLPAACGGVAQSSEQAGIEAAFTPPTYREGDRVVLPVTFPDGSGAELVHGPQLDIAGLGLTPYSSGRLRGRSPAPGRADAIGRDFRIFYGKLDDVLAARNGGSSPRLLAEYPGTDGKKVGFWDLASDSDYLGLQFGNWAVLVYDYGAVGALSGAAMTDAERAAWAASFSGRETSAGFLRLEGSGALRLARAGEHAGPELWFGSMGPSGWLALYPGRCTPHRDQTRLVHGKLVQRNRGFADWCLSGAMRAHATGPEAFIDTLIRELTVRNVALAT